MPLPRTKNNDSFYEEVKPLDVCDSSCQDEFTGALTRQTPSPTDTYISVSEFQKNENVINDLNPWLPQTGGDEQDSYYIPLLTSNGIVLF